MSFNIAWQSCKNELQGMVPEGDFVKWILPLAPSGTTERPVLLAPNQYVQKEVEQRFLVIFRERFHNVTISIDNHELAEDRRGKAGGSPKKRFSHKLNHEFTFQNFVEGKANELAKASAMQVSSNLGKSYNPLFIYGGVGLGKTHLMQSIGNAALMNNRSAVIAYVHSERFVADMVMALRNNSMPDFKERYRSADVLLIDDIQFFIGKERSQEEFFHTFNSLVENKRQIVITSDRYPKELKGMEERLASRCGSGLTVAIEVPDLETRVAIIKNKSQLLGIDMPTDVCFFIARNFKANVREMQGALNRLKANHSLSNEDIDLEFTKSSLKDLLSVSSKQITVEYIQKTVAEYFRIRVSDLLSRSRKRRVTRPRQIAMSLAKDTMNISLPEIGDHFGGRDHTTVIHAHRTITDLRRRDQAMDNDYCCLLKAINS